MSENSNANAYDRKFRRWHSDAWTRKPARSHFSRALFPLVAQARIVERGNALTEQLLTQRFFQYALFTSALERRAVNPAVTLIADDQSGVWLPHAMKLDAGRILTDESFHELESDLMIDKVITLSTVEPIPFGLPSFLRKLELSAEGKSAAERRLLNLGFAFISETLISTLLTYIPTDPTVAMEVQRYVDEHAKDKGRHHQFFRDFFAVWWPQLGNDEREFVGPFLPRFIRWFLEPDLAPFATVLERERYNKTDIEKLIAAAGAAGGDIQALQNSAGKTIRIIQDAGAFGTPAVAGAFAEAFEAASIDPGGIR